jgi:hypothetical protein
VLLVVLERKRRAHWMILVMRHEPGGVVLERPDKDYCKACGAEWPCGKAIVYCSECHRIKGVGCACDLSFDEKIKFASVYIPVHMRAEGS